MRRGKSLEQFEARTLSVPAQEILQARLSSSGCISKAGQNQTVSAGSLVTLDGSESLDFSGGPLTYATYLPL